MSICPNKNLPEWKTLVEEVGEYEAFRDFFENEGEIRTPEMVQEKLNKEEIELQETFAPVEAESEMLSVADIAYVNEEPLQQDMTAMVQ
jgi:hypothetical protein